MDGHKKNLVSVPKAGGIIPGPEHVEFCFLGVSGDIEKNLRRTGRIEVYR